MLSDKGFYFNANKDGEGAGLSVQSAPQGNAGKSGAGQNGSEESFEAWLAKQDDSVKSLYEEHVSNLKSALETERASRKNAEKKLKEAPAISGEKDSAEEKYTEIMGQLTEARSRAAFYEQASASSFGIRNMMGAYKLAMADGLIVGESVDFEQLRKSYPELFGSGRPPEANGGAGLNSRQYAKSNMNESIRSMAGRF